jgi:hypothetical protein
MPDQFHELFFRWRGVQLRAIGLPAVLAVCLLLLVALVPAGRFAGLW